MFGVVTIFAQSLETTQPLVASLFVVLPDLVAVETSLPAAYLATVDSPSINGPADAIPLDRGEQFGQTGQPGAGRYGLDGQF